MPRPSRTSTPPASTLPWAAIPPLAALPPSCVPVVIPATEHPLPRTGSATLKGADASLSAGRGDEAPSSRTGGPEEGERGRAGSVAGGGGGLEGAAGRVPAVDPYRRDLVEEPGEEDGLLRLIGDAVGHLDRRQEGADQRVAHFQEVAAARLLLPRFAPGGREVVDEGVVEPLGELVRHGPDVDQVVREGQAELRRRKGDLAARGVEIGVESEVGLDAVGPEVDEGEEDEDEGVAGEAPLRKLRRERAEEEVVEDLAFDVAVLLGPAGGRAGVVLGGAVGRQGERLGG